MNRRRFLSGITLASLPCFAASATLTSSSIFSETGKPAEPTSDELAKRLFARAEQEQWNRLPIGQIMVKAGMELVDSPYVGGTLEANGPEQCRVNLRELDCVTFFENMLAFARCVKKGASDLEAIRKEVLYTRYRDGILNGYESRLHYTAEWISNNVSKDVVIDITRDLDAKPFPLHVDFMSKHPQFYKPLQRDPSMINRIAAIEESINIKPHWFIPKADVAAMERHLQSGDIIAIATNKQGLDYAHTGMIARTDDKIAHFLHASLAKKKVTFDVSISEYLQSVSTHIGITIARPLEVH